MLWYPTHPQLPAGVDGSPVLGGPGVEGEVAAELGRGGRVGGLGRVRGGQQGQHLASRAVADTFISPNQAYLELKPAVERRAACCRGVVAG